MGRATRGNINSMLNLRMRGFNTGRICCEARRGILHYKTRQPIYVTDIAAASRLGDSLGASLPLLLPHPRGFHHMLALGTPQVH